MAETKIEALARRPAKGADMELMSALTLSPEEGVVEDYGQSRKRQITLISDRAWRKVEADLEQAVPWHTRRANVLVTALEFDRSNGYDIEIGECRLHVRGETVPCSQMDDACPGLRTALEPEIRGGVYAEVRQGGTIRPGDEVRIVDAT